MKRAYLIIVILWAVYNAVYNGELKPKDNEVLFCLIAINHVAAAIGLVLWMKGYDKNSYK
ncbi:hypothetical protein Harreka1_71 [Olleya phage Harreka_1]|uniref:Uncharacterized protein n=1 Tax=Olleya phage Harreka_1 TaxID=2745673 RepID=A0A8E4ZC26_9CAUD|nr:hypothetical protein M1M26_gp71 [Olleya phage Harreka_1]QQV90478.1 hypothetical protein Harreka1_71 [Olleya phage Harreka_1]